MNTVAPERVAIQQDMVGRQTKNENFQGVVTPPKGEPIYTVGFFREPALANKTLRVTVEVLD